MNEKLKSGLRDLLAFIEANDDINLETALRVTAYYRSWYLHTSTERSREAVLDMVRRLGTGKKKYGDDFFWFIKNFSDYVEFEVSTERNTVCERVKVGEEVVPEHVLPAREKTVVPERVVEKYVWRCSPLLPEEEVTQ